MNLINKDFLKQDEKIMKTAVTPFAKAKIYRAAEKEAMQLLGIKKADDVLHDELENKIIGVLCGWLVSAYSTPINI